MKDRVIRISMYSSIIFIIAHCVSFAAVAGPASSWSDLSIDKRCEGVLDFLRAKTAGEMPEWTLIKPKCVVAGGAEGDVSWSLDASWKKGTKALLLRFIVMESRTQKPKTSWCIVKGKKFACATPWESEFGQGNLFEKKADAKAAYQSVISLSQGFMVVATKLDEWAGKNSNLLKIYDLPYGEFVRAWANAPRSLPVKKDVFVAEYLLDRDSTTSGQVTFKDEPPEALKACLGCAKTDCKKSPILFVFSGLGLTISRDLTSEEQQYEKIKTARVSWIMMEPTPFVAGEPKWPFLCGEHRFNIQKL